MNHPRCPSRAKQSPRCQDCGKHSSTLENHPSGPLCPKCLAERSQPAAPSLEHGESMRKSAQKLDAAIAMRSKADQPALEVPEIKRKECNGPDRPAQAREPKSWEKVHEMARNLDSSLKVQWITNNPDHAWIGPSVIELLIQHYDAMKAERDEWRSEAQVRSDAYAEKCAKITRLEAELKGSQNACADNAHRIEYNVTRIKELEAELEDQKLKRERYHQAYNDECEKFQKETLAHSAALAELAESQRDRDGFKYQVACLDKELAEARAKAQEDLKLLMRTATDLSAARAEVERLKDLLKREQESGEKVWNRMKHYSKVLQGLLADTQHVDHACGDKDCPVEIAREALEEKGE